MIHNDDVISLEGASWSVRNRGIDTLPRINTEQQDPCTENRPLSTVETDQISGVGDT